MDYRISDFSIYLHQCSKIYDISIDRGVACDGFLRYIQANLSIESFSSLWKNGYEFLEKCNSARMKYI